MDKAKTEKTDLRYVDDGDWEDAKESEEGYLGRISDGKRLKQELLHRLYHAYDNYPEDLDAVQRAAFDRELNGSAGLRVGLENSIKRSIKRPYTFGSLFYYYDFEVRDFINMGKVHFDELTTLLREMGTSLRKLDKPHTRKANTAYAKQQGIVVEPCRMPDISDSIPEEDAIRYYHAWFCEKIRELEESGNIPVWVAEKDRDRIINRFFAEEAQEEIRSLENGIVFRIEKTEEDKIYQNRDPYLDAKLKVLGLPGYLANRLSWHGYGTIRKLKKARLSEIKIIPGMGDKSYQKLLEFLKRQEIELPE